MPAKPDRPDTSRARAREPKWQQPFLEAFAETGVVKSACRIAGVGRSTVYERRSVDEGFAAAWAQAELDAADVLEAEAVRRAVDGTERPVFQGGVEVGRIREFSDQLMIFLLKGRRPDRYGDRRQVEHEGQVGLHFVLSPDEQHSEREG